MKDSIASRISRIITGSANSIVSKIEGLSADAVLEQALAEIDSAIDEVRVELGIITAQRHNVTKAMTRLNNEHEKLEGQAAVALKEGREDLAEAAMGRQIDIEGQLPALESDLARLSAKEDEHQKAVAGLLAKRNEMEDELDEYRNSLKSGGESRSEVDGQGLSAIDKADRAETAFSRVLQRTTGIRSGPRGSGASTDSAKLVELAQLERNAKIQQKLDSLKASREQAGS